VWPAAGTIETQRLTLEPLRIEHADEMVSVLDDAALHEFTGGHPKTLGALRKTYRRQAVGHSPGGGRGWLNWIVRLRVGGSAIGAVQATLRDDHGEMTAELAWTIGSGHQGRGLAKEASSAMVGWLLERQVEIFSAHIRPGHAASIAVARHLGLRPTDELVDGEVTWVRDAIPSNLSSVAYRVISPSDLSWITRPHERGEPARHVAELSERAGFAHTCGNIWRYEPGAKGRRHRHPQQEETFVVLEGTLTMYVGEPPERVEVPRGGLIHVDAGTALQSANHGSEDLLVYAYGYPPESEQAELLDPAV
jgi:RimJ/RimL family protein N-acetyltransferase/mannose-6-phosphate isomerase-like protein (cupin superfamily)